MNIVVSTDSEFIVSEKKKVRISEVRFTSNALSIGSVISKISCSARSALSGDINLASFSDISIVIPRVIDT